MDLALKYERDDQGVVSLWVDQPDMPVVVLNRWLLQQIEMVFDQIEAGEPPNGFILHSASDRVFVAGADLNEINGLNDSELDEYLALGQKVFDRIEALPCPSVACINGAALGGGLEICLACQYRIAATAKRPYPIGLPEAGLGILPGWGGTQRLAAVIAPGHALGRTMTGRTFNPDTALRYGLIEELVEPDQLHDRALHLINTNPDPDRKRAIQQIAEQLKPSLAWAESCTTRPVRHLPAAQQVIEAVQTGLTDGIEAGLKAERDALVAMRKTPECEGMLGAFFARTGTLRKVAKSLSGPPSPTETIAILGESKTVAYLTKRFGRKSTVQSIDQENPESNDPAQVYIAAPTDDSRQDHLAALRTLGSIASDDSLIISTSSVLTIDEIAGSVTNPERIVGLVPGKPIGKSQACQIIRGSKTTDATVGAAVGLCKLLGLVPVVQTNGGPTLTVRLFSALAEASINAALACGDPAAVDRTAKQWGLPTGPLSMLDLIGLNTARTILNGSSIPSLGNVQQIYENRAACIPDETFIDLCGNDDFDPEQFTIELNNAIIGTAQTALNDHMVDSIETVWLALTFGLNLAPWQRAWMSKIKT